MTDYIKIFENKDEYLEYMNSTSTTKPNLSMILNKGVVKFNPIAEHTVPFSENLVFYAPLNNGDLTEHISGQELNYPQNGIEWNDEYEMYLFKKQAKNKEIYFPVDLYAAGVTSNNYTIFAECMPQTCHSTYNYPPYVVIGGYSDTTSWRPSLYCLGPNGGQNNYPEGRTLRAKRLVTVSQTSPYSCLYRISSGSVFTLLVITTSETSPKPSEWSGILRQRVALNPKRDNNDTYNVYLKDVRIYNRTFTQDELLRL